MTTGTDVVELVGEADLGSAELLEGRLAESLDQGRALIVDLTDCTFVDVRVLRVLRESYGRARLEGSGFFVILPFDAAYEVRLVMLRLAAALAPYPVVPDRATALVGLARAARERLADATRPERVQELRASVWENGRTRERLLADRNVLILEQRAALSARPRRAPRAGDLGG